MPSSWIIARATKDGGKRYRVLYRLGGREAKARYAGSFPTKTEALARKRWVDGELAGQRVPDLAALTREPERAPTLHAVAERWQTSRVDVRDSTTVQHKTALGRVLPTLGDRAVDAITPADIAELVGLLADAGKARESIRKSLTAVAMILDYADAPLCGRDSRGHPVNAARDRLTVKLPLEEPDEPEPPTADTVEAVAWKLATPYVLGLLVLDATGVRVGELEAAKIADLDEQQKAWLVRAAVSKTRRARWVPLPDDLFAAVIDRLPAREDRDPAAPLFDVTADRLRMAILRGCRDAGVPHFSPHALRHRRISLLHRQGVSWAEIGERVGQRSKVVTADRYSHALVDYREVNRAKLLGRVRRVRASVRTSAGENAPFAGAF
jgi:integrase